MTNRLSLSKAIESIRSELVDAQQHGEKADLKFTVGEIELELEIVAEFSASTGAKANWWVVTGEVGSQYKESSKHKLKIKLNATNPDGKSVEVSKTSTENPSRE
jgi:Trypsin-co-occurring domain 2